MLGMHGSYTANMAMHNADVILAVGARFDDRVTNGADKFCPDSTIIHIDVDPVSISKIFKADVPIVGDVRSVLSDLFQCVFELMPRVDGERLGSWWRTIEGWKDGLGLFPYEKGTGGPIKPQEVIEAIYNITNGEAFVTSDVGQHQMFAAQHYLFDKPNRWINSGGLGTMGFGLPAAMGVKLSFPDSEVVCITGDGSIQMNIQELSTCLQFGINVKIINLNNSSLGMVRQLQDINHGSRHSHSYMDSLPDFVAVAEAYSHLGVRITNREQLVGKLEEVFKINDQLVFVDIQVDPEEHVYPMQIKDGSMCEMYLSKTMSTEMF
jgi:acetolactate synthase-1/2/3 large subunit